MKKILSIVMVSLIVLSAFSILTPQTKAEPDETPLEVAEKAAVWVIDNAISEAGGYKWWYHHPTGSFQLPELSEGVSGIGTFLVSLYEKSGNSTYLDYAKGAAQWLISKAIPDSGGYKWKHPDATRPDWYLSTDVHDVGEFLLKMYKVTGNSTYLDYAKGAAQWMVAMAEPEFGGWFIPYNPPGKYGSQAAHGIGTSYVTHTVTFLLHMYQETGNTTYLIYVKGTAQWLISNQNPDKVAENGGYKWAHDRPYYVHPEYKYRIYGNAMIAHFFYETYQELGNETYLEYANGAVQWILSQGICYDNTCKWPLYQGETTYYISPMTSIYNYDHLNDVLLVGYSLTSNSTYLEYAKKNANWILSQAVLENGGYKFPYSEDAGSYIYNAYINALTYRFLSEMYNVVGNASYSEYANGAFTWIVNNATATNGGYKWKTRNHYPYYPWWFYWGASGIGYYLISAPPLTVPATIDVDPDTLNLASNGEWITAYIELPEGYSVGEIDVSIILLNDTISVDPEAPTQVGDYDTDGVPDLMVKFDRAAVIAWLGTADYSEDTGKSVEVTLVITGEVAGTPFEGADTIRVLSKG